MVGLHRPSDDTPIGLSAPGKRSSQPKPEVLANFATASDTPLTRYRFGTNPSGCPKPVEAGRTRRQHTIRHYEGMTVSPGGRYLSTSACAALWGQQFNEGGGVGSARLTVMRYECMIVMRSRRPGSARSLSLPRPPRESASPGGARLRAPARKLGASTLHQPATAYLRRGTQKRAPQRRAPVNGRNRRP